MILSRQNLFLLSSHVGLYAYFPGQLNLILNIALVQRYSIRCKSKPLLSPPDFIPDWHNYRLGDLSSPIVRNSTARLE